MRTARSFLLLTAATAAVICAVASSVVSAKSHGWSPLPVIDASKVQQLGRWAVTEHDKKANVDKVKFNWVVSGEKREDRQLGTKYHLVIDALDGSGRDRKYKAVLAEQVWIDRVILISFHPAT